VGAAGHLSGRTALVTGAASGIGLAVARRLHAAGARVLVTDRGGEALAAVERELGTTAFAADLSDRSDLARLVAEAGPVQILVNNAGLQHVSPVDEFPEESWDLLLAVLLTAPFLLTKAFLPGMIESSYGRVLNIASVHGLIASPYKAAYVSAKHGLLGLTKTVALEAAARCPDVTAHALCPTFVRTPLLEGQIAAQASAHELEEERVVAEVLLERNAVKRLLEPDDVAAAVEFLCGPGAWAMTGSVFPLDAGWLAH
jgi:3-hydroxybutyrate dehydrogenase